MNTAHLDIPNSDFSSCCGCRQHSGIAQKLSQVLVNLIFLCQNIQLSTARQGFVDIFHKSKSKQRQGNPEIATECFVFSVHLSHKA